MKTQSTLDGGTVVEAEEDEVLNELTSKLEEIFQFDKRDLDFGMYRVLKLRRAEVEAFMAGLAGEVRAILSEAPTAERIEVCNHLVEFFSRYYREGDFMSLPRRNETKPEYAVPYGGEEVLLHWANRDQYYIKTGRSFRVYEFQDDGGRHTIRFTVVEPETPLNNTKGDKCYFIPAEAGYDEATRLLTAMFDYRPVNSDEKKKAGSKIQEYFVEQAHAVVLAAAPDSLRPMLSRPPENDRRGVKESRSMLRVHLDRYTAENNEDYFIHKDLSGFLRRELDFYLKNAVIRLDALTSGGEVDLSVAVRKATAIKSIANRVIEMLDTTETMQRQLFEKKKLVVSADYCMTLDRVPEEFYREIAESDAQVTEWKDLFGVDVHDRSTLASSAVERMKACPSLVIDTRHFGEGFKDRLLASFDDLDEAVEGIMVKSENWQALNLLKARYREQVQCIYIDPPYNTGNDGFLYKDRYQHSSWLSMMENRASFAEDYLSPDGIFFCSIGEVEHPRLKHIFDEVFYKRPNICSLIWKSRDQKDDRAESRVSIDHEYVVVYGPKLRGSDRVEQYSNPDNDPRGPWTSANMVGLRSEEDRPRLHYDLIDPKTGINYGKPEMGWRYEPPTMSWLIQENRILWPSNPTGRPRRKKFVSELKYEYAGYSSVIGSNIYTSDGTAEVYSLFKKRALIFPKPSSLIRELAQQGCPKQGTIMDYFAGSGTTGHAILNLNCEDGGHRKYILIEMGEHFGSVMKPRIMKVMYAKTWKDGQPLLMNGEPDGQSHVFKYIALEQYEDTLANIVLPDLRTDERTLFDTAPSYLLTYLLDRAGTAPGPDTAAFKHPFAVTLRLHRETLAHPDNGLAGSSQTRPRPVDLPETFAYLLGLHIIRRRAFHDGGRRYLAYLGRRHDGHVIVIWRDTAEIDYAIDRAFITDTVLPSLRAGLAAPEAELYINGEAWVENARPIGPAFAGLLDTEEV